MCQLTYSNLNDPYLNSLMVYLLAKNGAKERHDDGCGMICPDNKVWKTELAADIITNLGDIIQSYVLDNRPIPFHVRWASFGIEVSKENSHPFDGKHYILMHNGTLLPRNGEEPKDKKKDSDSLKFLNSLDECRDINPNGTFEEIFNAAMANFAGKFAFIIREKETNDDYIIRGDTAELWISELEINKEKNGFVVNTSKDTLKKSFLEFVNIWALMNDEDCKFSEPVLLKKETIFTINGIEGLKEIGKAKEFAPTKPEVLAKKNNSLVPTTRHHRSYPEGWENLVDGIDSKDILEKAYKIYEYLYNHGMSLIDFQIMVMISSGISILEVTREDLEVFIDYIIPKISASDKIRRQIKGILNGQYFPTEIYEKYNLEYPWPVNDGKAVLNALRDYMKGG